MQFRFYNCAHPFDFYFMYIYWPFRKKIKKPTGKGKMSYLNIIFIQRDKKLFLSDAKLIK